MPDETKYQDGELIFALDIGTRSIIGVAGRVVDERLEVLAIEKEEHGKRAMLDGQIEDIDQVAKVARSVTDRMEAKLDCVLRRVSVAAAGRALRTEKGRFAMDLPQVSRIESDLISQLESGAVSDAESRLSDGDESPQRRFYLVGYTVSSYLLDRYPMTTLKGHTGQQLEAEVVATFLPSEVVESTSDIAVCRDGAVVGYTMATIAGDEITEELMRRYLVSFATAERMKMEMDSATITYRDVLGLEQSVPGVQIREALMGAAENLAQEIAQRVVALNGAPPSAVFLAGGGSKLVCLRDLVAQALDMSERRVALAGNNYSVSAFSQEYELNDPEYATPLGIAVSAGLGLISDSYRILLNGKPAKLFRSGTLTVLDLLMMNGYTSADLLGRTGKSLVVTVDGQRMTFRGESATPCTLLLNGRETTPSALVYAGDAIEFVPAVPGRSAARTVADLLGIDFPGGVMVNGTPVGLDWTLHSGDQVATREEPFELDAPEEPEEAPPEAPVPEPEPEPEPEEEVPAPVEPEPEMEPEAGPEPFPEAPAAPLSFARPLCVYLNGEPLVLPGKPGGEPYYLMDLLDRSGIDFSKLDCPVELLVNGEEGAFACELKSNDAVIIRRSERRPG